jgi:iron complex transport system permease protein
MTSQPTTRAAPALGGLPRAAVRPRTRAWRLAVLGVVVAVVASVLGIALGSVTIPLGDTLSVLIDHLVPGATSSVPPATDAIVWDLRVPRVLTALVVGCALAVAGATFQGLLRNPLADPYVLGTASGAALGAAIAVLVPVRLTIGGFGLVQVLAFAGALLAVTAVYRLSRVGGLSPLTSLLLTGYAVGSLLAAGLAMAMYLSGAALRTIVGFLLGGFEASSWERLTAVLPVIAVGTVLIALRARSLNALLLGEESAMHLGVDVRRERVILLTLASLVTAAAVTVSGLIGFVGLVVPHVVRLIVGPNARAVVPLSALWGANLMLLSDLGARVLGDLPVGVLTAVIGAPFFLVILRRARAGYEL